MKTLIASIAVNIVYLAASSALYPLNQTCSPPVSQGGTGYCGPPTCSKIISSVKSCTFQSSPRNYPALVASIQGKTCTQSSDPRCTSAALKALIVSTGIKAAYCNDQYLVIHSDMSPGFQEHLSSIATPPGGFNADGTACVTRSTTLVFDTYKIPLNPTLLTTSDPAINNINKRAFPNDVTFNADGTYMSGKTGVYGLPTKGVSSQNMNRYRQHLAMIAWNDLWFTLGALGLSIAGQEIFPTLNAFGEFAPGKCEVDTCNEHVGQGGGQPHLHGDPFGSWCLYSASNYSSETAHPPQIGWSFDGPSIYGRHLYTTTEGYDTTLDSCGGHIHGSYAYHYHPQVLSVVNNEKLTYYASSVGPYQCMKGDISLITNYWGRLLKSYTSEVPDTTTQICKGMTQYYAATGITVPFTSAAPSATPSAAPSGPSYAPTLKPTRPPTVAPSTPSTLYSVTQFVSGVVLSNANQTTNFKKALRSSLADILRLPASAVAIVSVTASAGRRLTEDVNELNSPIDELSAVEYILYHRPYLQAIGVTVVSAVTATGTTATAMSKSLTDNSPTISTALQLNGYPDAAVQDAFVVATTAAPASSPVKSSAGRASQHSMIVTLSAISSLLILHLST